MTSGVSCPLNARVAHVICLQTAWQKHLLMKTRLRKADFLYPCIQTLILYSAIIETITLELLKVAKNLNDFFMYLSLTGL